MSDEELQLTELLSRDSIELLESRAESEPRRLVIRLLRWDDEALTMQGRERFAPGAFREVDPTAVVIESQRHDGEIVGRGELLEERADGPYLTAVLARTRAAEDLVQLWRDRIVRGASVLFQPLRSRRAPDGALQRTAVKLARVAVLPNPAYAGGEVIEARAQEDPGMPEMDIELRGKARESSENEDDQTQDTAPAAPAAEERAQLAELQRFVARVDELEESVRRMGASSAVGSAGAGEAFPLLARHETFADAFVAAASDPETAGQLARALTDHTTSDIPGLLPPQYLQTVRGMVDLGRRAVTAFGGPASIGETGMQLNWPVVAPATKALPDSDFIAEQLTEKSEVVSGKFSVTNWQVDIRTFAGAGDWSWQALRRSSPSARETYLRYLAIRWARVIDAAFCAALVTDGDSGLGITLGNDSSALREALIADSLAVEAAIGQPASIVLAASDVFAAIAKLPDLYPPAYGTQNLPGTAQASTLRVNVSGLEIIHVPALGDGKLIVSTPEAAAWGEQGPFTAEAPVVARLGTDLAVWSMGAGLTYEPAAVIVETVTI